MAIGWSSVQTRRLKEMGAGRSDLEAVFPGTSERDRAFQALESRLTDALRRELMELQSRGRRPRLCALESQLAAGLMAQGFCQVATPTLMSRSLLSRMGIREGHALFHKIFWLNERQALRPMLAPHLYSVLRDLQRTWTLPIRLFEVGSCFRRETRGAKHAAEFTMLNLVEMGLPAESCQARLQELAAGVMATAGIEGYRLEREASVVYGSTVDVVVPLPGTEEGENEEDSGLLLELGSGAWGPHPLDRGWGITEPWVGIGFGLERLLMAREGGSLGRWVRSLGYLDGTRLAL
jgi:pyrrolysyl-tRNA synthetase-like protein